MTWTKVRISCLYNALKRVPRATLGCAWIAAGLTLLPETGRSQPCAPVPPGIVGWWTGDNNSLDQLGGAHGTLVGNAGYVVGRVGNAFAFDGSGDAIDLGVPYSLALQNYTIEAWVKRALTNSEGSLILSSGGRLAPRIPSPGLRRATGLEYGVTGRSSSRRLVSMPSGPRLKSPPLVGTMWR